MKFESSLSGSLTNQNEENRFSDETGKSFEETLLIKNAHEWDGELWQSLTKPEQEKMINDWMMAHIPKQDLINALELTTSRRNPRRPSVVTPEKIQQKLSHTDRLKKRDLMLGWICSNQPALWNPNQPLYLDGLSQVKNDFMATLLRNICLRSQKDLKEYDISLNENEVKMYTTLHSTVDTLYGIDVVIEIKNIRLTIDLTKNTDKSRNDPPYGKADRYITDEEIGNDVILLKTAEEIAKYFVREVVKDQKAAA